MGSVSPAVAPAMPSPAIWSLKVAIMSKNGLNSLFKGEAVELMGVRHEGEIVRTLLHIFQPCREFKERENQKSLKYANLLEIVNQSQNLTSTAGQEKDIRSYSHKMKMVQKHPSSQGGSRIGKNHKIAMAVFVQCACPYLFNAHSMICILRGSNS